MHELGYPTPRYMRVETDWAMQEELPGEPVEPEDALRSADAGLRAPPTRRISAFARRSGRSAGTAPPPEIECSRTRSRSLRPSRPHETCLGV